MATSKEQKVILSLISLASCLIDDLRDFGSENAESYDKQLDKILKQANKK
jgi:hypothetical protein